MHLKKFAAGAAMVGTLAIGAVGLGAGVASAAPSTPAAAGTLWQQGHGHWDDWGHDDGRYWGDRGNWGYGPGYGPGWGCVTGPLGHITWCP